jgi:hypothetical protein
MAFFMSTLSQAMAWLVCARQVKRTSSAVTGTPSLQRASGCRWKVRVL